MDGPRHSHSTARDHDCLTHGAHMPARTHELGHRRVGPPCQCCYSPVDLPQPQTGAVDFRATARASWCFSGPNPNRPRGEHIFLPELPSSSCYSTTSPSHHRQERNANRASPFHRGREETLTACLRRCSGTVGEPGEFAIARRTSTQSHWDGDRPGRQGLLNGLPCITIDLIHVVRANLVPKFGESLSEPSPSCLRCVASIVAWIRASLG